MERRVFRLPSLCSTVTGLSSQISVSNLLLCSSVHKGLTLLAARIRCDSSERVERDFAGAVDAARRVRGGDERGHGPGLCERCSQQLRVSNLCFANSLPRVRICWARSMYMHERISFSHGPQHCAHQISQGAGGVGPSFFKRLLEAANQGRNRWL